MSEITQINEKKKLVPPELKKKDAISTLAIKNIPTADSKAIMEECWFLENVQTFPEYLPENEIWAALSVIAWMPKGNEIAHNVLKVRPDYDFNELEEKIEVSRKATGPYFCKTIEKFGKCSICPHYQSKSISSPIQIVGPDTIVTAENGFYELVNGKKGKPNYVDLRAMFLREKGHTISIDGSGVIRTYNGRYYEDISKDRVRAYALEKFFPRCNKAMRDEFYDVMKMENIVTADDFTGSIQGKLNFQNGVYDIFETKFIEHSKKYGFMSVLGCEYDAKATAPRFMQFLDEVCCSNQDRITTIQEFLGYIFSGEDCKHQKGLIMLGEGSNGKSVLAQVIRLLAGPGGTSGLSIKDMSGEQNRHLMEGKLVNIAEENSKNSFGDVENVKNFIRGGIVRVKNVFMKPYEYTNRTKLVMLCNELPYTQDKTYGFFRSFFQVKFEATFSNELGNQDTDLIKKLELELPGIFNWVVEGALKLKTQGKFSPNPDSVLAIEEYQIDNDSFLQWLGENAEITDNANDRERKDDIYKDYRVFCEDSGDKYPYVKQKFFKLLKNAFKEKKVRYNEERTSREYRRVRMLWHIKLVNPVPF